MSAFRSRSGVSGHCPVGARCLPSPCLWRAQPRACGGPQSVGPRRARRRPGPRPRPARAVWTASSTALTNREPEHFNRKCRRRQIEAAARGQHFLSYGCALAKLRAALVGTQPGSEIMRAVFDDMQRRPSRALPRVTGYAYGRHASHLTMAGRRPGGGELHVEYSNRLAQNFGGRRGHAQLHQGSAITARDAAGRQRADQAAVSAGRGGEQRLIPGGGYRGHTQNSASFRGATVIRIDRRQGDELNGPLALGFWCHHEPFTSTTILPSRTSYLARSSASASESTLIAA
jgi:hypothetical protein